MMCETNEFSEMTGVSFFRKKCQIKVLPDKLKRDGRRQANVADRLKHGLDGHGEIGPIAREFEDLPNTGESMCVFPEIRSLVLGEVREIQR